MKSTSVFLVALALLFAVAAAVKADDKPPIRHLEFDAHVGVTEMSTDEGFNSFGSDMIVGGTTETISVDVLALANDGGMVVRAQEKNERSDRPEQAVTCAIYGDGRVACPNDAHVTDSIMILLSTLGRGWYDPAQIANNTWNKELNFNNMSVKSSFKRLSPDGTDPVKIVEHTEVASKGDLNAGSSSDTQITYDAALSVPLAIHDEQHARSHGPTGSYVRTDIRLVKDSFAKN